MTPHARGGYPRKLQAALTAAGVTGASFGYWDGERLHTATAGVRNSTTGDPVTADTVMHIGSITKVLNTVLLMQLVDERKINLEDPVVRHLPQLRLRDLQARRRITCEMLVNHTSGIDGLWLPRYGPDQERIVDTIDRCADLGQLHAPGEATSYCNVAPVIAGYLVQKLRGVSWYDLIRSQIFEPLKMRHALAEFADIPKFRCSIGHSTDPATGKLAPSSQPFLAPSFAPAGSTLMMTAADLVTFARTLLSGGVGPNGARVLSAESAARMARATAAFVTTPSHDLRVGLGWMIQPGEVLSHAGGGPGVYSHLYAHPGSGRVLAVLTNCDRLRALDPAIVDPILKSWTGIQKAPAPQRQSGPVDPAPYIGRYENIYWRYEIFEQNGGLRVRITNKIHSSDNRRPGVEWPVSVLYPIGEHVFEACNVEMTPRIEFKFIRPDVQGRMRFLAFSALLLPRAQ
jgi:CubicO group peptidase (beta-lactamase class C family)